MKNLFIKIHRILGSIMSLVFFIWFLSGFVMIYSDFPKPDKAKAFENQNSLNQFSNQIRTFENDSINLQDLKLSVLHHKPVYLYHNSIFNAENLKPINSFSTSTLDDFIVKEYGSSIKEKMIITDFDSWIPWSYYKKYFPIHKYYLNDNAETVVYLSEVSGNVVQETTSKTRWLARFGAIPHWFYFKSLRLKQGLWAELIIWISAIGCLMCLSGIMVGFYRSRKWRQAKKRGLLGFTPYKKKWYRWHHIIGMVFGIFVFTFVFSGMMSLMPVPQWIIPTKTTVNYKKIWNESVDSTNDFTLNIENLLSDSNFKNIKEIQYRKFDDVPYYLLYRKYNQSIWVNANDSSKGINQKIFTINELKKIATRKFKSLNFTTDSISTSDGYYRGQSEALQLKFNDADHTWIYIPVNNPDKMIIYNKNSRLGRWLYLGLHTFNFPALEGVEWLRKTLLIIVNIFGLIISLTGVFLSYKYFGRKIKKIKRQGAISKKKK